MHPASNASAESTQPYMIPVGRQDDSRLDSLSAMFNSLSLDWCEGSGVKSRTRFLDVGCGNGGFTVPFAIAHPNLSICGIDISPAQIEVAESKAKERGVGNITWDVCDVYHLSGLKVRHPQLFDVVHSRFVLTHLDQPTRAIDAMMEVLESGGVLLLEEFGEQVVYEVNADSLNQNAKKAIEGFARMVDFQAQMQKSHKVSPDTVEKHLKGKMDKLTVKLVDCKVTDSFAKRTFKMGIEIGIKKIQEMGMPQLLQKFGYENGADWIKDIDGLVNDDSITVTVRNVTYVSAIKK